ncbi:MAG: PIN domain-containing protein [Methanoregula sp.]|nr:PIN domain-containing protein [Methanoregula sp.]
MKIYLDVCCLYRLFDNHSDTRVRLEAEAVLAILKRCSLDWELVTSSAVLYEIGLISDPGKRSQALRLIQRARETIRVDDILLSRAEEFENLGVMGMDAVHIACTEKAGAVLLTTDDDLVKIMKKNILRISIRADNPLHWLMEMNQHGE